MSGTYSLSDYVADLRKITRDTEDEDEIISRVGPLARRLALGKEWLQQKHYETNAEQGFGAHLLHEEPDHSLAVLVAAWLPGRCGCGISGRTAGAQECSRSTGKSKRK